MTQRKSPKPLNRFHCRRCCWKTISMRFYSVLKMMALGIVYPFWMSSSSPVLPFKYWLVGRSAAQRCFFCIQFFSYESRIDSSNQKTAATTTTTTQNSIESMFLSTTHRHRMWLFTRNQYFRLFNVPTQTPQTAINADDNNFPTLMCLWTVRRRWLVFVLKSEKAERKLIRANIGPDEKCMRVFFCRNCLSAKSFVRSINASNLT